MSVYYKPIKGGEGEIRKLKTETGR
jgi:hypothetical protein